MTEAEEFGFHRSSDGLIHIDFDDVERQVIVSLADQVRQMVAPEPLAPDTDPIAAMVGIDVTAAVPDDPALARLLPDAFVDDDAASVEFRRFTERDLRLSKQGNASVVLAAVSDAATPIMVDAQAWLGFLNDVRLVLGERLGMEDDFDLEIADDGDRAGWMNLYDWLTYLQESLVQLLLA